MKKKMVCFPLGISIHSGWYWPQILQQPFTHTFLCLKQSPLTPRQSSSPPGTTGPSTAFMHLMHRRGAELNSGCTLSASFWWCLYISAAVTSMCCMSWVLRFAGVQSWLVMALQPSIYPTSLAWRGWGSCSAVWRTPGWLWWALPLT